jgi:hypothetical protein
MNFDFPVLQRTPAAIIKTNHSGSPTTLVKKIETELTKIFKESKETCKFYLIQITERDVKIEEFTDDSCFCCTTDLLCECYYDPMGKPIFSYLKTDRVKLSNHLISLKK